MILWHFSWSAFINSLPSKTVRISIIGGKKSRTSSKLIFPSNERTVYKLILLIWKKIYIYILYWLHKSNSNVYLLWRIRGRFFRHLIICVSVFFIIFYIMSIRLISFRLIFERHLQNALIIAFPFLYKSFCYHSEQSFLLKKKKKPCWYTFVLFIFGTC